MGDASNATNAKHVCTPFTCDSFLACRNFATFSSRATRNVSPWFFFASKGKNGSFALLPLRGNINPGNGSVETNAVHRRRAAKRDEVPSSGSSSSGPSTFRDEHTLSTTTGTTEARPSSNCASE